MKKLLYWLMTVVLATTSLACSASCGGGNSASEKEQESETTSETVSETIPGGDSSSSSGDDNVTYVDVPSAPVYAEIDYGGYTTYYFDSVSGDDGNDGTSEATPKKTLAAAEAAVDGATEGLRILFKGGSVFEGRLTLRNFGSSKEKPLYVGSYGDGRAIISADAGAAVSLLGDNARIFDLEIKNPKGSQGVRVEAAKNGVSENVVVENCYVHEVGWNWEYDFSVEAFAKGEGNTKDIVDVKKVCPDKSYHYSTCGIYFVAPKGDGQNYRMFRNVWVMNNKITETGRAGIIFDSSWQSGNGCGWGGVNKYRSMDDGWYPPEFVVISGNDVSYVGGDGIVPIGVQDCWIEHNTVIHSAILGRAGNACAGIWPVNARRVYIQYNEAGYTHLDNGCTDGEGFDIDIGCSEIYFQYNYSHDNAGGGLLLCNVHSQMPLYDENGRPVMDEETGRQKTFEDRGYWDKVYIRNNVFANNGASGSNAAFLVVSSDCYNAVCENNIVVMKKGMFSQNLITTADWGKSGKQKGFVFRNNIFYSIGEQYSQIDMSYSEDYVFENNLYWNFPESFFDEWNGITDASAILDLNPGITLPKDRNGYSVAAAFRPTNAEVFSKGKKLLSLNRYDFAGVKAEGKNYLGAFCA